MDFENDEIALLRIDHAGGQIGQIVTAAMLAVYQQYFEDSSLLPVRATAH